MGPGFESLKVHHRVCHFDAKGPPVPIPNTEVKLCSADNTCLETSREDRSMLTQAERQKKRAEQVRESVILTQRVHLFPFRTQKLSFAVLTILAWRRAGKISRSRPIKVAPMGATFIQSLTRWLDAIVLSLTLKNIKLSPTIIFLLSSVGRAHDC